MMTASGQKVIGLWFRNDLRLHDNIVFSEVSKLLKADASARVLPIFCYDPRFFGPGAVGRETSLPKCGLFRQRFLAESLLDFRNNLRKIGSDLLICHGKPEAVFQKFLPKGSIVLCQEECTSEELDVDKAIRNAGFDLRAYWGTTLFNPNDFPKGRTFSSCSKLLETARQSNIYPRELLPTPKDKSLPLPLMTDVIKQACNAHPTIWDETTHDPHPYVDDYDLDERGIMNNPGRDSWIKSQSKPGWRGGESAGLQRLEYYLGSKLLDNYKSTRNGLIGADYSSKLSAYLALGCVSPRLCYNRTKSRERITGQTPGSRHFVLELGFRDYFILLSRSMGKKIFWENGNLPAHKRNRKWSYDKVLFQKWKDGKTGFPLVDASMRELKLTGYSSNRSRQNTASFLINNYGIDWRWGAEYFEEVLTDHDVRVNTGNWATLAGVVCHNGNQARVSVFNVLKQAKDYDLNGDFVRLWCPELKDVPTKYIIQPWHSPQFRSLDYPQDRFSKIGVALHSGSGGAGGQKNVNSSGYSRGSGGSKWASSERPSNQKTLHHYFKKR